MMTLYLEALFDLQESLKKTGINPTCISEGIIQIESNAKINLSPIFLTPVEVKNDKTSKTFKSQY